MTLSRTTPGSTTDDDRCPYTPVRLNDYQSQYKPQNNYSPSMLLERQIGNQNAMMRLRFGNGGTFQPSNLNLSNLNGPTWAAPKYQFTPAGAKPAGRDCPNPRRSRWRPRAFGRRWRGGKGGGGVF